MRQNEFDTGSVVEYFDKDRFNEIPGKALFDFLPDIQNYERPILSAWKEYFIKNRVPFAITKTVDVYQDNGKARQSERFILWKQRRI